MLILQKFILNATQIFSSPITPISNFISENNCLFSGVCRTILQQWFVCIHFENFTDNFGKNPFFGGRYYVWNPDFIYSEIDLENEKNMENRMEK